jgi:hypothetical protein
MLLLATPKFETKGVQVAVGVNTLWRFNNRWSIRVSGNYGGFHLSDVNETWQGIGLLGYNFKMGDVSTAAFAGYRYLHLDYEDKPLEIDVDIKGPLVGAPVHKIPSWKENR